MTRQEAINLGLKWYATGEPCIHGHMSKRRTSNCVCYACEQSHRNFKLQGTSKHGLTGTVEHNIWCGIRRRCNQKTAPAYPYYGGRGVKICQRWDDFANFLADMGPRPSPKHSIERTNNDRGYEPGNCIWATKIEQMRNRRGNVYVTHRGQTLCVAAWAEKLNLNHLTIRRRLRLGQSAERALRPSQRPRQTT